MVRFSSRGFLLWLLPLLSPRAVAARKHPAVAASAAAFVAGSGGCGRQQTLPRAAKKKETPSAFGSGSGMSSSSQASDGGGDDVVTELLELVDGGGGNGYSKKTPEERQKILELMKKLEDRGKESRYLDDELYVGRGCDDETVGGMLQWDSYELKYFDRSIDGDRGSGDEKKKNIDQYKNATRPFGIRSRVLGKLFGLRYSFQHVVRPGRAVNDVGFRVLGIPASVVAGGNFTRVTDVDGALSRIRYDHGTELRRDTTVRIDFEEPVMWLGKARFFPLVLGLGTKAQSPPVTLCTTYMDDRVRLALAAKGGRLLFARGGKTNQEFATDWKVIEGKQPASGKVVAASLAVGAGAALKWVPFTRIPIAALTALPATMVLLKKARGTRRDGGGEKAKNPSG